MRKNGFGRIIWIVVKSAAITAVSFSAMAYVLKFEFISRSLFFMFIFLTCAALALEKLFVFAVARYFRSQGYNSRKMLIVGSGERLAQFMDRFEAHPEWGFKIAATIDEAQGLVTQELSRLIKQFSVDEVVFIVAGEKMGLIEGALKTCETIGVNATLSLDFFDMKVAKAYQTDLEGMPLISFETNRPRDWRRFVKRVMDLGISAAAIIVLSPIMIGAAILIKLTSEGPVFFFQKRLGLNGRKFVLYKFRTMQVGAQRRQRQLERLNVMQGPVFKIERDPRVTPVGRVLRKFSIDELPQLFNVFWGDMSLVGPRPPIGKEVKKYELWQRRRLSMQPGITCIWQVNGRNKIKDFNEWMNLDLQYIDKWSLWLDLQLLVKTVPVVFSGKGAC
jgi:exopolysaccharide biosynthesis polyprenyl glycosylphosphotransferase